MAEGIDARKGTDVRKGIDARKDIDARKGIDARKDTDVRKGTVVRKDTNIRKGSDMRKDTDDSYRYNARHGHDDRHRYDDIINLPHHVSGVHPPMKVRDRAAQFAPFSALTGYGEVVKEAARVTEERKELDESRKAVLDGELRLVRERILTEPVVTFTYFIPDMKKAGGTYVTVTDKVKRFDDQEHCVVLKDGTYIPIDEIVGVEIQG